MNKTKTRPFLQEGINWSSTFLNGTTWTTCAKSSRKSQKWISQRN